MIVYLYLLSEQYLYLKRNEKSPPQEICIINVHKSWLHTYDLNNNLLMMAMMSTFFLCESINLLCKRFRNKWSGLASIIINISKEKMRMHFSSMLHSFIINSFLLWSAMHRCFKLDFMIIKDVRNVTTSENNKNAEVFVTRVRDCVHQRVGKIQQQR